MMKNLILNEDYIITNEGYHVFTKSYLLKRGTCCLSDCLNCPYTISDKKDPMVPAEFCDAWTIDETFSEEENDEWE